VRLPHLFLALAVLAAVAGADGTVRIWTGDVMAPYRDFDFDAGTKVPEPITLVGVRNGTFSGKVVLGSTQPIRGVTGGDWTAPAGAAMSYAIVAVDRQGNVSAPAFARVR